MSESKKKIPKRRFKEFENADAWEQRKLFEVAEFNPKSELPDEFEYVDLESVVGTEMISHRTETKLSAPSRAQRLAKTGDVFYQTVRPYQKNNYLFVNTDSNYVFSTGYAQMRPNIDTTFLMSFIQTEAFVKVVLDNCTGTSYPAINSTDLSKLDILLPTSKDEQRKVGELFTHLDNLITLHQRKADKLKALKSAYLNEMFPEEGETKPKRRFKGFTDDWEQRKLGEFGKATSGTSIESEFTEAGKYKVISIGSYSEMSNYTDQGIRADKTNKTECRILNKDDLTMILNDKTASGNIIGRVLLIDADNTYIYNQRTERIEVNKNEYEPIFLYQLLNADNIRLKIIRASQGNTQIYVNWSAIRELKYTVPLLKSEQKQIGAFFSNLDNLITLHQRKVDKLQNLKKAYLNEMFV